MQKVILYPHGGSGNHGCEALVRSTAKILSGRAEIILASKSPEEDTRYGVDRLCKIVGQENRDISFLQNIWAKIKYHIFGDKLAYESLTYRNVLKQVDKGTICLSFGGDNYCYGKPVYIYIMNKLFKRRGAKTILWGCSIEPGNIDEPMLEDLRSYDLILARESITFEELVKRGLTNVKLSCDPAFVLNCATDVKLPKEFLTGNTVGINLSPMAYSYSAGETCLQKNYERLIEYIISKTDMNVALIPHVVWTDNDDRYTLKPLYEKYKSSGRICMTTDCDCEQIKCLISRCRFLITARTHASIAAYSSGIPTLVMGYSVKAKGIAKDLFGTYTDYVLPVQELESEDELLLAFKNLMSQENTIREVLAKKKSVLEGVALGMANYIC